MTTGVFLIKAMHLIGCFGTRKIPKSLKSVLATAKLSVCMRPFLCRRRSSDRGNDLKHVFLQFEFFHKIRYLNLWLADTANDMFLRCDHYLCAYIYTRIVTYVLARVSGGQTVVAHGVFYCFGRR